MEQSDSEMLPLLYEGNREAYRQLFLQYYSPLVEYASQFIPDEEAEELVQDLMLHLWENRKRLLIETSLGSYLRVATKFRCLNAIKKESYHKRVHRAIYDELKQQFEDPDYYSVEDLTRQLMQAVEELPETYRDTFIRSRFEGYTNARTALELNVSVKTVEYRIKQALKILRDRFKDYLAVYPMLW